MSYTAYSKLTWAMSMRNRSACPVDSHHPIAGLVFFLLKLVLYCNDLNLETGSFQGLQDRKFLQGFRSGNCQFVLIECNQSVAGRQVQRLRGLIVLRRG